MCGIFCILAKNEHNIVEKLSEIYQNYAFNIEKRGPNYTRIEVATSGEYALLFSASVLWLQGPKLVKQPIQNSTSVLVYNGDIFDESSTDKRALHGDTKLLLDELEQKVGAKECFQVGSGPHAFVYLDKNSEKLYFCRDKFGRRSLLIGIQRGLAGGPIILTSVAKRKSGFDFIELPSLGLFSLDLRSGQLFLQPWFKNGGYKTKLGELEAFLGAPVVEINSNDVIIHCETVHTPPERFLTGNSHDEPMLSFSKTFKKEIDYLTNLLEASVKVRISNNPKHCQKCLPEQLKCNHPTLGVLFSGGIDCTILALIADKFVPKNTPIDLLNVAFDKGGNYNTPDRLTGLHSLEELKELCPNREWNFVKIDVSTDELNKERNRHIADLIYPLNLVLDDSLGCALWFASRGKTLTYESPCRILLVGMGADELFGGYTKHRAAYKKGGWLELKNALDNDWENLPYRNLARDDRVVSDHGRQLRTPYLDEKVFDFVRGLPPWKKTWPTEDVPQGVGEKILLRCVGYQMGLENAAFLKKRALQFGSRIANSKENGNAVSDRLL